MTRILRILVAAAALAAGSFNVAYAQGTATVTFNDPNCASWGMTQSGSTFTLTCQSLVCTVTADKPAPLPTDSPNLTAACTGATSSTTYAWTRTGGPGTCPAVTGAGTPGVNTANVAAPGSGNPQLGCVYKVAASDPVAGSGTGTITLNFTATPPSSPSGCKVTFSTGSANMPNAGGAITMVGSCTTNVDANTTYAWTKSAAPFVSGATASDTLGAGGASGATWTYVFQATNAGAATTNTQQIVTVAGSGGGGASLDMSSCTAQGLTGRLYDQTYSTTKNIDGDTSADLPGGVFGPSDVLVVRFTTAASDSNGAGIQLNPTATYYQSNKIATLQAGPFACLIAPSSSAGGSGGVIATTNGLFPNLHWAVSKTPVFGQTTLQPNTTYYVTYVLRDNYGSAVSNCPNSDCRQDVHFQN